MFRHIAITSLSIPILILVLFFGVSLIFLAVDLSSGSEYSNSWLGIAYAGLIYSWFAVLISSLPTIAIGLPASLVAKKNNALNAKTILLGASILGAIFLSFFGMILFNSYEIKVFIWLAFIGFFGGLFNGYIFLKVLKPNKTRNEMDATYVAPIR